MDHNTCIWLLVFEMENASENENPSEEMEEDLEVEIPLVNKPTGQSSGPSNVA